MDAFKKIITITLWITLGVILLQWLVFWNSETTLNEIIEQAIIALVIALLLTTLSSYYGDFISKRYSWADAPRKRLLFGSIGTVFLLLLGYGFVRFTLFITYYQGEMADFLPRENPSDYLVFFVISLIISSIFHALGFYKALQETKVKEQKIIAGTASAKFDALKNQLDPHFLFNSLNVLTSLIEEQPYQAQKFTTSLSKVYRYVLEQKNKDLVSVDDELQFAKTYIRLLKMRFEDSIVFDIPEKSTNPEAKIIPLSLQLLLENAVKHNIVTSDKPLQIQVSEENNVLIIRNNLQEKQVVKKSSGVGLTNIQERYRILTDRKVRIHKTATDFSVALPMLTKRVTAKETQEMYIEDKRYEKAKERVEAIKGFYGNLMSYCIVIPILIFINYKTTSFPWAIFPTLGWGFGLTAHGLEAFGYNPLFGKNWEERKMQELMDDENF